MIKSLWIPCKKIPQTEKTVSAIRNEYTNYDHNLSEGMMSDNMLSDHSLSDFIMSDGVLSLSNDVLSYGSWPSLTETDGIVLSQGVTTLDSVTYP
jgi:hypothetical protein